MTVIDELYQQIADAQQKIKEIQKECSHPLAVRETKNHGKDKAMEEECQNELTGRITDALYVTLLGLQINHGKDMETERECRNKMVDKTPESV